VNRNMQVCMPILFAVALVQIVSMAAETSAQTAASAGELRISGAVSTSLILTVADLKKMPRKTLSVVNPHDKKQEA
jgi:DMSO/TMAO reductase YedYZ molybdopterin-dependent catalytic subunit